MNEAFKDILQYLKMERGFDFSGYRPSMIERQIIRRGTATECEDQTAYLRYLQRHPHELDRLVDALTINVSRFFRNALTFEYLAHKIIPLIIQEKARLRNHSLRVWSAGCALGEEPYSIAIVIKEILNKEDLGLKLSIFATDIDKEALKKAVAAVYPFDGIRNVKYGLLKRYFTPVENHGKQGEDMGEECFQLVREIRDTVSFSFYDMLNPNTFAPPESIFGGFDVVLCRNVLIYFKIDHRDIIFDKLYRSLNQNGYLVLGEAEILNTGYERFFRKVDANCHVYRKQ